MANFHYFYLQQHLYRVNHCIFQFLTETFMDKVTNLVIDTYSSVIHHSLSLEIAKSFVATIAYGVDKYLSVKEVSMNLMRNAGPNWLNFL